FFFSWSGDHPDLPSFPTRRSSDLLGKRPVSFSSRQSGNIGLQLMNRGGLDGDDPINKVANRNEAYDLVPLEHWQVPDPVLSHQPHAFFHGMRRAYVDEFLGEDFLYGRLFGRFALEGHFPGVIAFRKNADEFALIYDEEGADVF